uniref:Uncharacterized protein n=1 Tax=Rhabditophanes sp. KR3021 TaxID=114890 RepID=A0AC35UG88_9BILA
MKKKSEESERFADRVQKQIAAKIGLTTTEWRGAPSSFHSDFKAFHESPNSHDHGINVYLDSPTEKAIHLHIHSILETKMEIYRISQRLQDPINELEAIVNKDLNLLHSGISEVPFVVSVIARYAKDIIRIAEVIQIGLSGRQRDARIAMMDLESYKDILTNYARKMDHIGNAISTGNLDYNFPNNILTSVDAAKLIWHATQRIISHIKKASDSFYAENLTPKLILQMPKIFLKKKNLIDRNYKVDSPKNKVNEENKQNEQTKPRFIYDKKINQNFNAKKEIDDKKIVSKLSRLLESLPLKSIIDETTCEQRSVKDVTVKCEFQASASASNTVTTTTTQQVAPQPGGIISGTCGDIFSSCYNFCSRIINCIGGCERALFGKRRFLEVEYNDDFAAIKNFAEILQELEKQLDF